jgi:hypothetical protein
MGTWLRATYLQPVAGGASTTKGSEMPRYMVERTFPEALKIPINDDSISEVRVPDPYFYS